MRITWKRVHMAIAFVWCMSLVVIACKIALVGNETARMGKQWGIYENTQRELNYELGQLRHQIEWKANQGYIEQKVRDMKLPIKPRLDRGLVAQQP